MLYDILCAAVRAAPGLRQVLEGHAFLAVPGLVGHAAAVLVMIDMISSFIMIIIIILDTIMSINIVVYSHDQYHAYYHHRHY